MCVVSMVMDHKYDEWRRVLPTAPQNPYVPATLPYAPAPTILITQQEIDEFRRLLERAREYDRRNNEPDCELEEKKRKLLDLAKELGVDISFVEEV